MANFWNSIKGSDDTQNNTAFSLPNYNYAEKIKSPDELGMSPEGSFTAIGKNVGGLINYAQLLTQGGGDAQTVPGALGPAGFIETGAKCKDVNGNIRTRSLYINTIPVGDIPFLSSAMGANFSEYLGIVPGMLGNVASINPTAMFSSFTAPSNPVCYESSFFVRDPKTHKSSVETGFLADSDLSGINPCHFKGCKNPITGKSSSGCPKGTCIGEVHDLPNEGFANIIDKEKQGRSDKDILNNLENIVYVSIFLGFILIILKLREISKFGEISNIQDFKKSFKKIDLSKIFTDVLDMLP